MKNLIYILLLLPALLFGQVETLNFSGEVCLKLEKDSLGNVKNLSISSVTEDAPSSTLTQGQKDLLDKGEKFVKNFYGFNVSTEADSLVRVGAFEAIGKQRIRAFYLIEKDLCFEGIYADGGVPPRDATIFNTPTVYKSVDWNCTLYPNKFRFEKLASLTDELTLTLEVILNGLREYRKFPRKDFEFWELGGEARAYQTVRNLSKGFFKAHSPIIESKELKFVEVRNESWHYLRGQWVLVEAGFMDEYIAYNKEMGRGDDFASYLPKLGTNALPFGQATSTGAAYPLELDDLVTKYAKYYSYVNLHTYPIDRHGNWSTDFNIVAEQIDAAIAFQAKHFPTAHVRITETGSELEPVAYYAKLDNFLLDRPIVQAVFAYPLVKIPNARFNALKYWENGKWNATGKLLIEFNKRNRA